MKKNVAGQTIGAQMLTAADGSAFAGAVTVFVTGDGGAQAQGSVGSGACVHEGNGYHSYAPAQAETNFDHVAFTFIGSGAAPATVQGYTMFPQAGDTFARVGAPAGASVSADVAAVAAKTTNLPSDPADQSLIIAATDAITTAVAAVAAKTALIPAAPAAVGDIPTAAVIADAVHDEAVDGAVTLRQSIRLQNSVLAGKASGLGTATVRYRDLADTKDRIVGTADADGNRTAVTRDAT